MRFSLYPIYLIVIVLIYIAVRCDVLIIIKTLHAAWRKCIRRLWKINSKPHTILLHHINHCLLRDVLVEKRCIKFIYDIINNEHSLLSKANKYLYKLS